MIPRKRVLLFPLLALCIAGCSTAPKTPEQREALRDTADAALKSMVADNPGLKNTIDTAYAYAIFPKVTKAGLVAGGGHGQGVVYEQGRFIGYADMTKFNVGAQIGAQTFRQLIAFENSEALDRFKHGKMKFDANASAVILEAGAAAAAKYQDGVAVFVQTTGGAMAEASIGGQEFGFRPADGAPTTRDTQ